MTPSSPSRTASKTGSKTAPKGVCRCEAHIAPAILDGYACGNADCWRTAVVKASFDAFVQELRTRRGDVPEGAAPASHAD